MVGRSSLMMLHNLSDHVSADHMTDSQLMSYPNAIEEVPVPDEPPTSITKGS